VRLTVTTIVISTLYSSQPVRLMDMIFRIIEKIKTVKITKMLPLLSTLWEKTVIVCEKCYETTSVVTTKNIEVKDGSLTIAPYSGGRPRIFTCSGECPRRHIQFHLYNPEELRNPTNGEGSHSFICHATKVCECQFYGCRERTTYYCVDEGCTQHQHRFSRDPNHLLDSKGTYICKAHQGHHYLHMRLRGGEINDDAIKFRKEQCIGNNKTKKRKFR